LASPTGFEPVLEELFVARVFSRLVTYCVAHTDASARTE
jgi:hypothetical protein